MKRLLLLLAVVAAPLYAAAPAGFNDDEIALWAAPVEGGVFEAHRAEQAVNPASTMKLLTSWAALNRLGPNFRWQTEFRSSAPLQNGVLQGDLYWLGRGDPRLDSARLTEMLRQLRLRGVRDIAGRLVLDQSAWQGLGAADGFGGDADRVFTVAPHTHQLNLKVAWLRYYFDNGQPQALLDPPLPGVSVDSRLQAAAGNGSSCGDVRRYVKVVQQGARLGVSGSLPPACDGAANYVNLLDSNEFAQQAFAALWQQLGGSGPRGLALATTPAGARSLLRQDSADTLAGVLVDMNKYSNNTMARSVLLTLGAQYPASGNTFADGERQLRSLLVEHALPQQPLLLENGAGLSRRERVSAQLLGEVLRDALRGPYGPELAASLPLAGEDGTLKKRLGDVGGSLRLKTGSLDNVRALAGYWQAPSGQRLVLVAIVNSPRADKLTPQLDAAVAALVARYQARLAASAAAGL
ncbi:D-alanyl-D-alanine carboxypeptidase/D-alanyl-D-alanine-endopeptidase [Vogesella sp. LIG4]|uniref:D-alanyl-D-alanine carboxypeptidase/D-alanyl-D-alanine endopeptidase n=1 Tax=Vogesella sp. LIG4 TaxID=1192162 RepID=UPI00081FDDD2|nr:D-alanyl-D-alanine carboxypeptidase/D-alanyl-D-alanine-endopeptidase [Vogesella sp. LIG4]SCK07382.1 D-alanyl-D-alanine carboxypeptidase / D-alanyl-D-alanine-endopeptidase (penicillin-binding protein 4) [Vogesella sp. LIG4]